MPGLNDHNKYRRPTPLNETLSAGAQKILEQLGGTATAYVDTLQIDPHNHSVPHARVVYAGERVPIDPAHVTPSMMRNAVHSPYTDDGAGRLIIREN